MSSEIRQINKHFCSNIWYLISSKTSISYADHLPAGSSAKPFVHYAQLHLADNEFLKYDYGPRENAARYNGSKTPPPYNLSNVIAPTALFVGESDDLGTVEDNNHLAEVLPNCFHHEVINEKWSHMDFAVAIDAPEKIYSTITSYIEEFERNKYNEI